MDKLIKADEIRNRIFTIRNVQVVLDRDLADLYGVETRVLNQAVKRNEKRFPEEFMFKLTKEDVENWKSQIVISNKEIMGLRKPPHAFTEAGVSMLSALLNSDTAIKISVEIIKAFVEMRKFIVNNALIFQRLDKVEHKQIIAENKIDILFNALQSNELKPKQGIFFNGQVFDAYVFISKIIKSAKSSIVLIDNYIDETTLQLFTKRNKNVTVKLFTKAITKVLKQDLEKHNSQYPKIEIEIFPDAHDRFLIIDDITIYHIGASLKDLGKKWFAFSKMDSNAVLILERLKNDRH